jgi:RHS repeat-associated protein
MCTGTSPTSCQAQWTSSYSYLFDTSTYLPNNADPTRYPGASINPIKTKILSHTDSFQGTAVTLNDLTQYWVPIPANPYTYPTVSSGTATSNPPTTLQVSEVEQPDGSWSETFTANLCPSNVHDRDLCVAVPFETFNSDGSKTEYMWVPNGTAAPGVPAGDLFNPFVQYTVYTPPSGANVKVVSSQQDQNGNTTSVSEYDWQSPSVVTRDNNTGLITSIANGTPLRTTSTTYYTGTGQQPYWAHGAPANLRSPNTVTVGNATTTYNFDSPTSTGNVTSVSQNDSLSGTITTSWTYLPNGNVQTITDPNSNASGSGVITLICYDSNNLYPVKRIVGATNSSCASPTQVAEAQTTAFNFNFTSGTLTSTTDQDNSVTTTNTYDNIGRTVQMEQSGGGLDRKTATGYDDIGLAVTTTQDDAATQLVTTTKYDALGRVQSVTDGAGNQVQKAYRYGNQSLTQSQSSNPSPIQCSGSPNPCVSYEVTSNPYLSTNDATMGWTVVTRDAINDIVTTNHYAGGSAPPLNPGQAGTGTTVSTTKPAGSTGCPSGTLATQATDEAGNIHSYCSDGLGRTTAVVEPDGTVTNYFYNAFDNLTGVQAPVPSGQSPACANSLLRSFTYSNFSRLMYACNPENNTVNYNSYDANGNVTQFTDGENVVNNLTYDTLNRLKSKSYLVPSGSSITGTSPVLYTYDLGGFKGALSQACVLSCSAGAGTVIDTFTYDAFGRIVASSQQMGSSAAFAFGTSVASPGYKYTLTDQLTQITYPSGRVVKYSLDGVDRITTVTNGATSSNYASINYATSPGNTITLGLGNSVTEKPSFNDRFQPIGLQATSPSASPQLTLGLYPCAGNVTSCATGNNGNVQSQTIAATLPTGSFSATQRYGYDHLNRLTQATETGAAGTNWSQGYSYVGNGNRWVSSNTGNPALTLTPETPVTASAYSSSPVVNRINTWTYDNNGNIRVIPIVTNQSRSFTYDAENRAVGATITSLGTTTASYVYDALGQRVSKTVNGLTTTYVYDAFGNLTAEYGAAEASPCGTPTCYVTVDHLGSMRMLTDSNGNPQRLYDYQPFGTELPGGFWGRTTAMGYQASPDDLGPKYTGQSRDPETGLDWFQVRHMSGAQGRFQSVDPGNAGANPADPQTWNMYAYVGNNPMSSTDPSGMDAAAIGAVLGGAPGAVIGTLVDLGFLLGDLLGGGGHTPTLQDFPFPDQVAGGGVAGGSGGGGMGPFGSSLLDDGISAAPLPPDSPMDIVLGPVKQATADIVYALSLGKPTTAGQWLIDNLQPTSRLQKTSATAFHLYGMATAVGEFRLIQFGTGRKLSNILNDLFRAKGAIGSGSTADAIRYELQTGLKVGGKTHLTKGIEYRNALLKMLRDPSLSAGERATVKAILTDLQNALSGY